MSGSNSTAFEETNEGKARCNCEVRRRLDTAGDHSSDWKVIIDFYEALHWVEVYLTTKCPALRRRISHHDTLQDVQANLRQLYRSYFDLYQASRVFRYQTQYAESIDVAKADSHVSRIRDHVRQELSLP